MISKVYVIRVQLLTLVVYGLVKIGGAFRRYNNPQCEEGRAVNPREPVKNPSHQGEPCWVFKDLNDQQNQLTRLSSNQ